MFNSFVKTNSGEMNNLKVICTIILCNKHSYLLHDIYVYVKRSKRLDDLVLVSVPLLRVIELKEK